MKKHRLIFTAIAGTVLLGIAGMAYSPRQDGGNESTAEEGVANAGRAAIETFWEIFHDNDYTDIPIAQAQLETALRRDPNNATLYALLGATHFWHIGEYQRDPKSDPNVLQQDMPTAVDLFQRAVNLDYYGKHIIGYINDDHLPGYLGITTVHAGQMSNNSDLVAKGDQTLDFAAYQFPEFNNFNRWAAHNSDPKGSEAYRKALDSLWQALDVCVGTSIDRTNPDIGPYLQLQTAVGRKKACWSEGDLAPHSFEGFMLNLGNGLVKAGQVDAARIVYANAKYATNYATWPYRTVLEFIENSDLYARAALYSDNDASNDPPLGVPNRGCSYCHAMVPEPGVRFNGSTP